MRSIISNRIQSDAEYSTNHLAGRAGTPSMCIFLHHFSGRYDRKKGVSELPNFSNQFFLSRVEKESSQPTPMSDNLNAGSLTMNIKEALGPLVVDAGCGAFNYFLLLYLGS